MFCKHWVVFALLLGTFFQGVTAWQCKCTFMFLSRAMSSHLFLMTFLIFSSNLFDSRCFEFAGDAFGTFVRWTCTGTSAGDEHCRRAPCGFCFGFCSVFFSRPESHWRPDCRQTGVGWSGDSNTYFSGEQRAAIIHKFIYKMRLYLCMPHFHALSSWKCECRVLREVSTPVLLMQMSLAMGQRKVLLHQWCRLQRIKVLGWANHVRHGGTHADTVKHC